MEIRDVMVRSSSCFWMCTHRMARLDSAEAINSEDMPLFRFSFETAGADIYRRN
jgi:hypothetical protein